MKRQRKHKHAYRTVADLEHVPLKNERHTSFVILQCGCGDLIVFPQDNLLTAINNWTQDTYEVLKPYYELPKEHEYIDD